MRRASVLAFVVGVLVLVPAVAAFAATGFTNADCLGCHSAGSTITTSVADFSAPAVDFANCNRCHWYASHPPHGAPSSSPCAVCHTAWPSNLPVPYYASYTTTFGVFSEAEPPRDPATLHALHAKRTWPSDLTSRGSNCASCHGPAACTACHGTGVAHDTHPTQNGAPAPVAPVSELSPGTNGTLQSTAFTAAESCAAATCHGGLADERITDDLDSSVATSGAWTRYSNTVWYGGTILRSSTAGSSLTIPFTGNQVSVWGYTSTSAGKVSFTVDGTLLATKNLAESRTTSNNGVWTSNDLGPGAHTLVISVVSTDAAKVVVFDRLVARDFVAPPVAKPQCAGCHVDKTAPHGYGVERHTSTTTLAGCIASGCHSTRDLMLEHEHWRPDFLCGNCHSTEAPQAVKDAIAAGDTACSACHPGFDTHASAHVVSAPAECLTCHETSNPVVLHANSPLGGCAVCHANPTFGDMTAGKTDTGCLQCHAYSPFDPNHYHASVHVSSAEPEQCAGCHDMELLPEHVASAGFVPGTQCANCHTGAIWTALQRPWDKTCEACHPTKHAGAAAAHEATLDHSCTAICHKVSDVTLIHSRASTTTAGGETLSGCNVCHVSRDVQPASTDCISCHGPLTNEHGALGSIRGRVRDSVTGAPVAGAFVLLDGVRRVKTDRRGDFVLRDVVAGWHTVGAARAGYRTGSVEAHVGFGQALGVDVPMSTRRAVLKRR